MIVQCSCRLPGTQNQTRCNDIVSGRISRDVTINRRCRIVVDNVATRRCNAHIAGCADELAKINVIGGKQPDVTVTCRDIGRRTQQNRACRRFNVNRTGPARTHFRSSVKRHAMSRNNADVAAAARDVNTCCYRDVFTRTTRLKQNIATFKCGDCGI